MNSFISETSVEEWFRGDGFRYFLNEVGTGWTAAEKALGEEEEVRPRRGVYCRRCRYRIAEEESRIQVNGSHTHTFFNPAGILFELACFREAAGCSLEGAASQQFSWFAGYFWRIALCRQCTTHLGWRFEGQGTTFFSLILTNLTADSD